MHPFFPFCTIFKEFDFLNKYEAERIEKIHIVDLIDGQKGVAWVGDGFIFNLIMILLIKQLTNLKKIYIFFFKVMLLDMLINFWENYYI